MANLSITRQNVAITQWFSSALEIVTIGEAVTQMQPLYRATAGGFGAIYYKAEAGDTQAKSVVTHLAMTPGAAGDKVIAVRDGIIVSGGTMVQDLDYYLSATSGAICPYADLVSTDWIVKIGRAISETVFGVSIQNTGTQIP